MYVVYLFLCCLCADYGDWIYQKAKRLPGVRLWTVCFLLLSCVSAILTIGREMVSDYTLYANNHVEAALYIEQSTPPDTVILTNDRHVNEITSLTGRNIVSGSPLLLSTHGIYDEQKVQDVKSMFEDPAASAALFEKYDVDYIMISSWERSSFALDETLFDQLFTCVFTSGDIRIYQIHQL